MSLVARTPQPTLAWQFQSSNVDSITGLAPNLSTTGNYAAPAGGTITTVAGQRIHTFTTVGTTSITFLVPVTAQLLVIGAGAGGGGNNGAASAGGGGGAGEYYYSASYSIAAGTYTVTVGAGGTGGVTSTSDGNDGGASVFGSLSANGGGGGSTGGLGNNGRPGGSGGGCGRSAGSTGGASVKTAGGLGNKGGDNANSANFSAGGGGGSASAGTNAYVSGVTPVPGGSGTPNSISGASVTYASGGNGGARNGTYTPSGGTFRGDGGDGAPAGTGTAVNGAGGNNGIVVVSYNAALYPAPTYVSGIYKQAINFNNTLSAAGADPNCYAIYDVSSYNLTSNSGAMSLWLNSGLTYPIASGCNPYYINLNGTTYYSLQTENNAANRSNISFHTGMVGGNFASRAALPGWNHYCYVYSNVGATGDSNTISYAYLNGTLIGSSNNYSQKFTELRLACQNSLQNGALCSIDDVRLFKTPLNASQVQSIYAAQGMPGLSDWTNTIGTSKSFFKNK